MLLPEDTIEVVDHLSTSDNVRKFSCKKCLKSVTSKSFHNRDKISRDKKQRRDIKLKRQYNKRSSRENK